MFLRLPFARTNLLKYTASFSTKYLRDKRHINVGVLGHQAHGKSTLTAAITKYLSKKGFCEFRGIKDLAKSPEERSKGYTINTATVEYETEKCHFCHVDCPGHTDYGKNTIIGATRMDIGIMVVANKGPETQTIEHLIIAKHAGISDIVVYLNKVDFIKDPTDLEIITMEMRDFLTKYGFNGEKAKFVQGSALCALEGTKPEIGEKSIKALLDAVEAVELPPRDLKSPFMLQIDHTTNVIGKGTGGTGIVKRGKIKLGEDVDILGYQYGAFRTRILGMDSFEKSMNHAEAGDSVMLFFRGTNPRNLYRGQTVSAACSMSAKTRFEGQVTILLPEEGGRDRPFNERFKPQCFIGCADVPINMKFPEGVETVSPGDKLKMAFKLEKALPLEKGMKFIIKDGTKTVAVGEVTNVPGDTIEDIEKATTGKDIKKRK